MNGPRLSRRKIVAAAMRIADEKDMAAVTLRGIAARLDVHVTSLYNHISTREELLDEMVKALVSEASLPTDASSWQDWVRRFAAAMRGLARKHPGAFEAFHYRPAQGERAAEAFEAGFEAFRAAGFDAVSMYGAVKATIVAVLGLVLDDTGRVRSRGQRTDVSDLPVERFPRLHEVDRVAGEADTFDYLIEVLIAGFDSNRQRSTADSRRAGDDRG